MIKAIQKPFVSVLKWGTVVTATAVVVISIQGRADSNIVNADLSAEDSAVLQNVDLKMPVAPDSQKDWAPSLGFADLIEEVSPAVVHVATAGYVKNRRNTTRRPQFRGPRGFEDLFRDFFEGYPNAPQQNQNNDRDQVPGDSAEQGGDRETQPLGIGSGFIISADGYVVTNHHVINNADEIVVTLTNGDEYEAEVKGSDEKTDVALLKLKNAKGLPYVVWGDDEKSRVGDWVLAIGNPFGLGGSASTGIISAIGRDINSGPYDDFIQVDAAINRGNSGGPLFNTKGQVIGINTAIYSPNGGSVGIGFSIPATMAKNVINQLESSGAVERAWIGVSIQPLGDDLAEGFGRNNDHGALIRSVEPDTPAVKAGLQAGDIILSFDGEKIESMRDLPRIVAQSKVGEKYKMSIWRDGKEKSLTIKTERFPEIGTAGNSKTPNETEPESSDDELLGAQLSALNDELRERYGLNDQVAGVLLLSVERDGLAAKNGLRRGDVISSLNGQSVSTSEEVNEVILSAQSAARSTVPVLLIRNNGPRFLPFKIK